MPTDTHRRQRVLIYTLVERLPTILRALPTDAAEEIVQDEIELALRFGTRPPGIAVVDAESLSSEARGALVRWSAGGGWQVFIDCAMNERGIDALLSVARAGLAGVLLRTEGVDSHALRFRNVAMSQIGVELLAAFAPRIARMAPQLSVATLKLCVGDQPILSVTELAVLAGMSRRWIEGQLADAGIRSARALVDTVLFARAHPLLINPTQSLAMAAQAGHLGTARTARRRIESLAAAPIRTVRSGMPVRELVERMTRSLG